MPRSVAQIEARGLVAALAAALAFAITAFAPQVLNDGDTFLHVAAGTRMIAQHAVLVADPFSYTVHGAPWDAHEWLAEIAMALAYNAGGWSGLLLLFACAAALAAGTLSYALGRWIEPKAQALTTVLAMACMASSLLARPHLLALPLLAIWMSGLVVARAQARAPSLWLLPVMALWANIHGSFLLGLVLAGGLGLEALIAQGRGALRGWLSFGAGAVAATLLNPHGIGGLLFPFQLMAMPSLGNIGEWQATELSLVQPLILVSLAAAYVLITRRVRVPLLRLAMVLGLLGMALLHARHQIVFAIAAPLLLAQPLGQVAPPQMSDGRRGIAALLAALMLGGLAIARLTLPAARVDSPVAPIAALAHVPPSLRATPVLNDYSFGAYLIFSRVPVYIDSRAELYGEAALERYAALIKPDAAMLDGELRRHGVRWTILPPASPLVAELDAKRGWHRLYADRFAIVQFRDGAAR
jgi:hypothetical protein